MPTQRSGSQNQSLADWWAILGAEANQTYAIAQLLRTPSPQTPQNSDNQDLPPEPVPLRKRDRLKALLTWKKPAEVPKPDVCDSQTGTVIQRRKSGSQHQKSSFSITLHFGRRKRPSDLKNPFVVGPGACTTSVCAVNTTRV